MIRFQDTACALSTEVQTGVCGLLMFTQFCVWLLLINFQYTGNTLPVKPEAATPDIATDTWVDTVPAAAEAEMPAKSCPPLIFPATPEAALPDKPRDCAPDKNPAAPAAVTLVTPTAVEELTFPTKPFICVTDAQGITLELLFVQTTT